MILVNAALVPVESPAVERGYLKIEEGKIAALGPMEELGPTAGEEVMDCSGLTVYPGFIDCHTHMGMWEDGLGFEGADGNEETDPATPQLRAIDAVNHRDRCFAEARAAGVTTVITGPGSANCIGGQLCAVKTRMSRIDTGVLRQTAAMKFALGENPKTVYNDKEMAPITRMATAAIIREQLYKAQRYLEDRDRAAEDEDFDEPDWDMKCEALLPLLRGEIGAHFHAHRADDIFTALRLAREFGLRPAIVHGTEGHLIAEALREEGAPVICGPLLCDRSKPELRNLTPKTPGVLAAAGVEVALCTDHPVIPIQYLPLEAGLAVREGMAREDALRAITLTPARICGLEGRVGSLAVGKDADLALFSGDPFSVYETPHHVFIDGEIVNNL